MPLTLSHARGPTEPPLRDITLGELSFVCDEPSCDLARGAVGLTSEEIRARVIAARGQIGDELDQIEDELPTMAQPQITPRLRQVKQDLLQIRRALWPLRDVLGGLASGQCPYVQEETRNYLRDCQDHCAQLIDIVGLYRELAADLVDLQISVAGQRMNEVMKVLTVMATLFIPLTFISSIYGMNFDPEVSPLNMPELKWFWGYPFALGLMGLTAFGLLVYFRRRGWI